MFVSHAPSLASQPYFSSCACAGERGRGKGRKNFLPFPRPLSPAHAHEEKYGWLARLPCAMDLSATDSSAMAWRSTQQRRIAAESTEEREARLHQLSVTQRQRIAAESTEEREARLQQLRILPNRNNHQDLLINCHIPILLVLIVIML